MLLDFSFTNIAYSIVYDSLFKEEISLKIMRVRWNAGQIWLIYTTRKTSQYLNFDRHNFEANLTLVIQRFYF